MSSESTYELAQRLIAAEISVVPIRVDMPKAAAVPWEAYETRLATETELATWFKGRHRGIAAIGGAVSGGLECLDFDEPGLLEQWLDEVDQSSPGMLKRLVIVHTPNNGGHVWFRSPNCEPNQALAWRPPTEDELREKPKVKKYKRIETRGAGGYALLPGGDPRAHPTARPYTYSPIGLGDISRVDRITADERELLVSLCRAFNTYAEPPKVQPARQADGLSPGDDFDRRGSWQDVLEPHGWQLERGTWEDGRLTRPGKASGVSATLGVCRGQNGEPLLHVFSSAAGIEMGTYGRFNALVALSFNGDRSAAAKELAAKGYGERTKPAAKGAKSNGSREGREPTVKPWEAEPPCGLADQGITADALMLLDIPPAKFAIDGLLCEGLNVLGGRPKMGKSWYALLLAWAVAGGNDLDGRQSRAGSVLYLALEDTRRRLQSRLRMLQGATGWDFPGSLQIHTAFPRADEGGLYFVAKWIEEHKADARLVVIDTAGKFRKPAKGNGNSYADDYEAFGEIKGLVDQYGVSALVIHHTRKLAAEDPFDELSGTLAISGAADGLMILDRKRGADEARLFLTGRDLSDTTIPMKVDRESFRWHLGAAIDGIETSGRQGSPAPNKVEQCALWLKEFLKDFAYPSSEIADAAKKAGYSFSCLRDAKAMLGREGTGEMQNLNFGGGGKGNNDWWSGLGDWQKWVRRPVDSRESRESQADGPDFWPESGTLGGTLGRRGESPNGSEIPD